ncbi:MAG: PQQ-binding-like beta-propeller repeat protein, partial [Bryobacteraceae bacterium]
MNKTLLAKWIAGLLLPPVGLVLVWFGSGWRVPRKLLATLALIVWTIAAPIYLFNMHIAVDGSSSRPIITFGKVDSHYDEIEKSRAQQAAVPAPSPAAAAPAETAPAAKPGESAKAETPKPAVAPNAVLSTYWTSFRGPNRDGVYDQLPVLTKWPDAGLTPVWKEPVGLGYASFTIAQGRAFTIEQRRKQEVVAAYDLLTGRELWTHRWDAEFKEFLGGDGPRATPIWDAGRVYALGAQGDLHVLDAATGKKIWSRNILTENGASNLQWGASGAPLIVGDTVVVLPGGPAGKSVVAYNKVTGAPAWSSLDDKTAYVTPMLATVAGKRQILVVTGHRVVGLVPETGALLWEYPWQTTNDINISQPIVVGPSRIFISAGYGHGAAVFELTPAGEGFEAKTVWANTKMKSKFSTAVLHDGFIYGLDENILACIDPKTGDL